MVDEGKSTKICIINNWSQNNYTIEEKYHADRWDVKMGFGLSFF